MDFTKPLNFTVMNIIKSTLSSAILVLLLSCGSSGLKIEEIDTYVANKIQSDQVYDIKVGPKYSRDDEIIHAVSYSQGDTLVMISFEETTNAHYYYRSVFFKEGEPIYIDDYKEEGLDKSPLFTERKVYFAKGKVKSVLMKQTNNASELDELSYTAGSVNTEDYDLEMYLNAANQDGDFDLKYGEFMEMPGQTYLILENEESGYNAALMILESDAFLDNLYTKKDLHKGRSIMIYPQFRTIDGVDRMVYAGGKLKK